MEEDKITLEKAELLLMMTEYWSLDNNENCEAATKIFLERNNIEDFLENWSSIDNYSEPTCSDREAYEQNLQERRN